MSGWPWLFAAAAVAFVVGILIQVLLAGAAVFEMIDFKPHMGLGWVLAYAPLLLILLAILARGGRSTILLTIALALDTMFQPELAAARHDTPLVAALHPLNAMLLFLLAFLVAPRAVALARTPLLHTAPAIRPGSRHRRRRSPTESSPARPGHEPLISGTNARYHLAVRRAPVRRCRVEGAAMRLARQAHLVLSFLFVGGVVVQVFLAGLGVFDSPSSFQTHANWGYLLRSSR